MKNILKPIVIITLILTIVGGVNTEQASAGVVNTAVVDNTLYTFNASAKVAKKTKAYKTANTTGGDYGNYSVGNTLTIVGVQGSYYKVKYKNTYAFIAQGDVTVTVTETSKTGTATINSSIGFNVRQYP